MNKLFFLIISFISGNIICSAQSLDSLSILIKDIQRGETDVVRNQANEKFLSRFEKILLDSGSFERNFDSLKSVSVQSSPDNAFRIYSWVLPHYDGNEFDYFGFIQIRADTATTLIRLIDSTMTIQKPESEKLRNDRWLGAIYYSIIPVTKSGKTYYTLLGWKAKDQNNTQKLIEVLYFDGSKIRFGFPLFKTGSVFKNRMLFTFSSQATMILRFDKNYNGIVFDHISGDKKNPSVISGPDGTYDAFKLKKGKWILNKDVDVGTKWEPVETLPVPPTR